MNHKAACYISCSPSLLRFSGVLPTHDRSSLTSVFIHEFHNTFFLNAHVPSLHQNHFGVITRLIFMDRLGKQTNSLWSHSRTKGKGLHLFAMSLGLQRHPLFACLYNFFSFSYVLYCCNSYTWPSLYLPNRNVHWGTQENKGRQLSPARHAAAKTHSCSRADCQLTGEAGWGTKVTI